MCFLNTLKTSLWARRGRSNFTYKPAWIDYGDKGTSRGSPWAYDTRVPMLFYGAGIKKGSSIAKVAITDIAPTIAILLKVQFPNGCPGKPLDVFKK